MTEELKKALEEYYSKPSPYYTAWKRFVEEHPNSRLLQPINKG